MSGPRVVAPGKLMLAGEYSVLLPNGVAWALAIPLGVEVEVTPSPRWKLVREDLALTWTEGDPRVPEALRFAHTAMALTRERLDLAPQRLSMRPRAGVETGARKPGVGGSAAICAAICAVLHTIDDDALDERRDTIFEAALEAHRTAQGGRGSGYDVATVVYGDLTVFHSASPEAPACARALPWPTGLYALAGSAGSGANTRSLLGRLEARHADDPLKVQAALQELAKPVVDLEAIFKNHAITELFAALSTCQQALERFDRELSLGVITPAITRLLEIAAHEGVTAKVSGAGGGDSVIALSDNPEQLQRLTRAWRETGFGVHSLRPAPGIALHPVTAR
ncbi:MAG: hypothetical protein JRH20_12210 [Deltaproteobacteria bacterium]|nr:hypothetical protein [Deltaproteobacteria bacterium]